MTMHLLGPAYTTNNTRKRNSKVPASKYAQDWVDYNKQMKKLGIKTKTYDEYVAYRQGKFKPKLRGTKMPEAYKSDHRDRYKSEDGIGVTFAKKPNEYTGTLIKGIATMHKSNAVPVINQDQMEEISRMRRG